METSVHLYANIPTQKNMFPKSLIMTEKLLDIKISHQLISFTT